MIGDDPHSQHTKMEDPGIKKLLTEINEGFKSHRDDVAITVEKTVKEVVNGKIDKLTNNFNDWKKTETDKRTAIESKLDRYMETTQPVVDFFTNVTIGKKLFFYFLSGVSLLGGTILIIKQIFQK